jgi:hypothetical protein
MAPPRAARNLSLALETLFPPLRKTYLLGEGGRGGGGGSGFGWLRSPNSMADPRLIISCRCCSSMFGLGSGAELTCITQFGHKAVWPVPLQTRQRLRKIQDRVFPVPSHRRQSSMRRRVPHTQHLRRLASIPTPPPRSGSLIVNSFRAFWFWLYRLDSASAGSTLSQSICSASPQQMSAHPLGSSRTGVAQRITSLRCNSSSRSSRTSTPNGCA